MEKIENIILFIILLDLIKLNWFLKRFETLDSHEPCAQITDRAGLGFTLCD